MHDATTFHFLNVTGSVQSAADWDDPAHGRLWRYNLHYFDDLNAQDAVVRGQWHRALMARWVRENPAGFGTGWEPYPVSLRIVNWIKWALAAIARGDSGLATRVVESLATQTRWLRKKLEIHLLANHLWANAKALAFAGMFFEGAEATRWFQTGATILEREIEEQILPDGGHFERSPMYHATVLEDVLDLINLAHVFPSHFPPPLLDRCQHTATRMLRWLRVMTHPDGGPSFFNDAAFGIAAEYGWLADYARGLGVQIDEQPLVPIEVLEDSGYVRLQNEWATLICDVAPIGPDYLPGHAHADTLSFELSVDGKRVLVNGGTSTYESSLERQRQRGTAAHNTVVVDGQDSSEVWGSFRVARRARPLGVAWGHDNGGPWLVAAHDGYRRLTGRVTHRRRWRLEAQGLSVMDHLNGRFSSAIAVLRLHPDLCVRPADRSTSVVLVSGEARHITLSCEPQTEISSTQSTWHPEFGRVLPTTMLTIPINGEWLATRLTW